MSNVTYNQEWSTARQELQDQYKYEKPEDAALQPKDRDTLVQHLALLYVKYIQIFRKIEDSYDQIVHPQKRRTVRLVLDSVMGRLLEVKHLLVENECSEIHQFDDILLDLKLVPSDLEIPIPHYFMEEMQKELEERRKFVGSHNVQILDDKRKNVDSELSLADAVRIIQTSERARQGRMRAKVLKEVRQEEKQSHDFQGNDANDVEATEAVTKIQRLFRGFKSRKTVADMDREEQVFLRMMAPERDPKNNALAKAENIRIKRKQTQQKFEEEYQLALVSIKEKLNENEGPSMKESMQDNFRQWCMDYRAVMGKFPEFPDDEEWQKEGFKFTLPKDTVTENPDGQGDEGDEGKKGKGSAGKKGSAKGSAKKKESAGKKKNSAGSKKGGKPGSAKKGEEGEETNEFQLPESKFLDEAKAKNDEFHNFWSTRDETDNFAQMHDSDIIKENKRREVEAEIKLQVFELLKEELKNFKMNGEKGGKGKKGKGSAKKKGKKDKKGKKGSAKKKGKKEKDLTGGRPIEALIEELVEAGIMQETLPMKIQDYKGDFSYLASLMPDLTPSMADIRRIITEYCVLPLGYHLNEDMHVPFVKGLLLYGPRGTGKTALAHAICAETGATLFNLSPKNTAGQYSGKANVARMLNTVFKVARTKPPALIYIEDVEMVFAKKVPKDDLSDPKRIKKDIIKYVKNLRPSERVMVLGVSYKPWEADFKGMYGLFNKYIYIPKPDYSSRQMMWREFIFKCGGGLGSNSAARLVDTSVLSRVSDGYTAGSILNAVKNVLTDRRRKQLKEKPLTTTEFVSYLTSQEPVYDGIEDSFKGFNEKLPMEKKRRELTATTDAPAAEDAKKKGGDDKKKKK